MTKLLSYLKYRLPLLIFYVISAAIVLAVMYLANQDMIYARYAVLLISFFLFIILLVDGIQFARRKRMLDALSSTLLTASRELPEPANALEADYVEAVRKLGAAYDAIKQRLSASYSDSLEYYTLWVHQIKTPISALNLVLSQANDDTAGVIKQELFKIEQYADMALRYVKLTDISSDLVIERCELGGIVHECIKKFGVLFVYKKLSVDISPIDLIVLSDRRWLLFILEQIISNAIKYTAKGGIRVYMQGRQLVIEDSGIGIRTEDLPRIFSKGYTGYNGRLDSRASGVGLYLAKKAAYALKIAIRVESAVGRGTKALLSFPNPDTEIFR
jgi:signal transduction histidine kinase